MSIVYLYVSGYFLSFCFSSHLSDNTFIQFSPKYHKALWKVAKHMDGQWLKYQVFKCSQYLEILNSKLPFLYRTNLGNHGRLLHTTDVMEWYTFVSSGIKYITSCFTQLQLSVPFLQSNMMQIPFLCNSIQICLQSIHETDSQTYLYHLVFKSDIPESLSVDAYLNNIFWCTNTHNYGGFMFDLFFSYISLSEITYTLHM
jgi:hypothetical protein